MSQTVSFLWCSVAAAVVYSLHSFYDLSQRECVCLSHGCTSVKTLCTWTWPRFAFCLCQRCVYPDKTVPCVFCSGQPQCVSARLRGVGTERLSAVWPWRPAGHVDTPHRQVRLKAPVLPYCSKGVRGFVNVCVCVCFFSSVLFLSTIATI